MNEACGCIYVDDYDEPEFYSATVRKARKQYRCAECHKDIVPGDQYEHVTAKWEGTIGRVRTCLDCVSIRKVFYCEGFEHHSMLETLAEHILEMSGNISSECLVRLTPGARAVVCDMIEEHWEETYDDGEVSDER